MARTQYEVICVDLASSMDDFTVALMKESRRIFLATTPEVVALHMAKARLGRLKDLGLHDRVSLLLNRKVRHDISDAEVANLVGLPVSYSFSNDYAGVQGSILNAVPVSHESDLGQKYLESGAVDGASPLRLRNHPPTNENSPEFFRQLPTHEKETGLAHMITDLARPVHKPMTTISSLSPDLMRSSVAELEQALFNHEQWCEGLYSTLICRLPPDQRDMEDDARIRGADSASGTTGPGP